MKRIMHKIMGLVAVSLLTATTVRADIVADADSAYINDDFSSAVTLYTAAIDSLGPSAERYYNLGNAWFRLDKPGKAIVNYERALRMDPTNADIRDNLEFVNSRLTDRIEASDSFVSDSMDSMARTMHPDVWGTLALVAFVLTLAGVIIYFCADGVTLRKIGFFGAAVLSVITILTCVFAWRAAGLVTAADRAIIIKPSVILSTTPRQPKDRSEEAFLLHEGTPVTILDSISEPSDPTGLLKWYDVKVDGAHRAWISSDSVEKI